MSQYVFTEDERGRCGYVGVRYSEAQARDLADNYFGITHIIEADSLAEAKQKLRDKKMRGTKDSGELYKNIRNEATKEEVDEG